MGDFWLICVTCLSSVAVGLLWRMEAMPLPLMLWLVIMAIRRR